MNKKIPRIVPFGIRGTPRPMQPRANRCYLDPNDAWVQYNRAMAEKKASEGDHDGARKHLAMIHEEQSQ